MTVLEDNGKKTKVKLHDYKYVPDLHMYLFSITKATDQGYKLSNGTGDQRNHYSLYHPRMKELIRFTQEFRSANGVVVALKAVSPKTQENYCNPALLDEKTVHPYNYFHQLSPFPLITYI